jgi:protein neuralized
MVSDVVNFRHSVTTASTSTTRGKSWQPQRQSKRTTRSSSYSDELPLSSHPYSMESSSSNHGRPSYTAEQNANSVAIHTSSKACRYRATDVNKLMPFHATACGRNVSLSADCFTATRLRSDYCNAYVFTQHPLWPGHEVVIRIISTSRDYAGGLTVGLTSCDPISIKVADLPDDADLLLDRPEYWVVHKNICSHPKVNDELAFYRTLSGELKYYRNGRESGTLMHVDCTLPLWAFFDIYGSTQRIQIIVIVRRSVPGNQIAPAVINDLPLGSHHEYSHQSVVDDDIQLSSHNPLCEHLSHLSLAANIQTETSRLGSLGNQRGTTSECQSVLQQSSVFSTASVTDFLHGIPVTLPPPLIPIPENLSHESITDGTTSLCEEGKPQIASTSADDRIVKLSSTGYESVAGSQHQQVNAPTRGECAICMECEPDCALYPCGHMCMCHSCAMNVQKQRSALCPICRQPIVDILRIYRT